MEGFRDFLDTKATRAAVFDKVEEAFRQREKLEGRHVDLNFSDVKLDRRDYSLHDQKRAILEGRDLTVPVRATVKLTDKAGTVLGERRMTLAQVPFVTGRGTMISKGVEHIVTNQSRLKPGVFTREKSNGELESHFNVAPGTGTSFRINMEPDSGVFRLNIAQANIKLLPVLKAVGIPSEVMQKAWGTELYNKNLAAAAGDPRAVEKAYQKILGRNALPHLDSREQGRALVQAFAESKLDPLVMSQTLGQEVSKVTNDVLLGATKRILGVFNGKEEPDDRDSLAFRTVHGAEDFLAEKVTKDAGNVSRRIMYKMDGHKDLSKLPAGAWSGQIHSLLTGDSRALPLEEINPMEFLDNQSRISSLGEGGIGSVRSVPDESHNVHPSQFGMIDPIRGPESEKIGIDVRAAYNTFKGPNGKLLSKLLNTRTGKTVLVAPEKLTQAVVAFPGEMDKEKGKVKAMSGGQIVHVSKDKVDYALGSGADMFSNTSNLVPMMGAVQGNRLFMGARAIPQALPLDDADSPLVMAKVPGKEQSFDNLYGSLIGTRKAKVGGTVVGVSKTDITVEDSSGKKTLHDLYDAFPMNRKTFLDHRPQVKVGDKVKTGDVLATSNFTDKEGTLAMGKNLRVAFMPYRGYNFEDGIVVSESAAKKLTSTHMYGLEKEQDKDTEISRQRFVSKFPTKFSKAQFETIDEDGVIRPGSTVKAGDPLVLAVREKGITASDAMLGKLHKALRNPVVASPLTWDHHQDGVVTDVVKKAGEVRVFVRGKASLEVGDKLSGRYGNKGVVSKILPDDLMPQLEDGRPVEVVLNPLGVVSRINPAQVHETLLGKVVEKTGKPYLMEAFKGGNLIDFTEKELANAGLTDTEELLDPLTGKKIPKVLTGVQYMLKLHKTSGSGFSAREVSRYTADLRPARGGDEGSKKVSSMEINALIGHGATENLREISALKGEKNDELWRRVRLGQPLPSPKVPFIYDKFIASLKGAGVNVHKKGDLTQVLPMLDSEITQMSQGEIKNSRMLSARTLKPEKGGLFDPGMTGGATGTRWSHISMPEPILNPVMEEPARRILGLTQKGLMDLVSGKEAVEGKHGGSGLAAALKKVDVSKEIEKAKGEIKSGRKSQRDDAVKRLGFLQTMRDNNISPSDMMLTKLPVIPPVFRPVSVSSTGVVVSDANLLYRDLMNAKEGLEGLKGELPESALTAERIHVYNAAKAVVGLGDPVSVKNVNKNVKGFIHQVVGDIPKTGMFQSKVLGKQQDVTGRAVVIPDPTLDMDQVGIPEEMAWKVFKPFIMRKMVTRGMSASRASQEVDDRTPSAKNALQVVMAERPVLVNRNPSLHKFNLMALRPVLRSDLNIAMPATISSGFNLDHDGDQMNLHVPVTDAAVNEAFDKMLPSGNLFSLKSRKAHFLPMQESVLGLFKATSAAGPGKVRQFASEKEAIVAYRRGEVGLTDAIDVVS